MGADVQKVATHWIPLVYDEVHALAKRFLLSERVNHTLQPTALVHETYLHLLQQSVPLADRARFLQIATRAMRQVLVNHARRHRCLKRGSGRTLPLDETLVVFEERSWDLVALDEALTRLAELDPLPARIIELRFFGGLTMQEISDVLEVPKRSVEREWAMARAWLRRAVRDE